MCNFATTDCKIESGIHLTLRMVLNQWIQAPIFDSLQATAISFPKPTALIQMSTQDTRTPVLTKAIFPVVADSSV